MRDRFTVELSGGCLGDLVPNGARVVVDPSETIRPLDLVHVTIKRDSDGPWARFIRGCGDDFTGATKIFLGWFDAGLLVGRIAAPTRRRAA